MTTSTIPHKRVESKWERHFIRYYYINEVKYSNIANFLQQYIATAMGEPNKKNTKQILYGHFC